MLNILKLFFAGVGLCTLVNSVTYQSGIVWLSIDENDESEEE